VQLLAMLAQSSEFENMQVREDELAELDSLARQVAAYEVRGGPENKHGKVNILLQVTFPLTTPPPASDLAFFTTRHVLVGLFELCVVLNPPQSAPGSPGCRTEQGVRASFPRRSCGNEEWLASPHLSPWRFRLTTLMAMHLNVSELCCCLGLS
jgi:hypothetical protein